MWSFSRLLSHACFVLLLLGGCGSDKVWSVNPPDEESKHGTLHVEIWGLPGDSEAAVKVLGSDGFERMLQGATILEELPLVAYAVEAEIVHSSGRPYVPEVWGSPVLLVADSTSYIQVRYIPGEPPEPEPVTSGDLRVEITGLPLGARAIVKVRSSDGFEKEVRESTTLEDLPLVAYAVEAEVVHVDGQPFYPSVLGSPVHLDPESLTTVHVHHVPHPFSITAPSLVLPLTSEAILGVEVARFEDFEDAVTLEIVDPFPKGILASTRIQVVPGNLHRASFSLIAGDQVEALDAPMWLRIRASGGGRSSEHFVEFRVAALVTSPSDDGPGSLREVIRAATIVSDAPRVRFSSAAFSAPTEIPLESELKISSTVDLEGPLANGQPLVTLTPARGAHRLVFVEDGMVRLASLRLERGTATGDGGCLQNAGTLLVEGVTARRCNARRGGAIANTGQLEIRGGTFTSNVAQAEGGGIFSTGQLAISQLALVGNSAQRGGGLGLGSNSADAELVGVTFTSNQAAEGGALWAQGPVTISLRSTVMRENRAQGDGGAIRLQADATLFAKSTQLLDNGAARGGAVFVDEAATAHLQLVDLEANEAEEGGAVHSAGMMTLASTNLVGNIALTGSGGAIVNSGSLTIDSGRLEANAAAVDGGAILHESAIPLLVIGSAFVENTAVKMGGALRIEEGAQAIIEDASFLRSFSADGGAIMSDGSLNILNSIFEDNESFIVPGTQWLSGGGGAIVSRGSLSVRTSQFRANRSYAAGGAIWANGQSTIEGSLFEENETGSYGGGVFTAEFGALTVGTSTFLFNKASSSGGGLENRGITEIFNSTFHGNTGLGGPRFAIHGEKGTTRLFHTTVIGNGQGLFVAADAEIFASILADNGGFDLRMSDSTGPAFTSLGYNLVGIVSPEVAPSLDPTDQWGTSGFPLAPRLDVLTDNGGPTPTMLPLPTSPVRNRIPWEACHRDSEGWTWRTVHHWRDQRGVSRPLPLLGSCNIGAVESP